MPRAESDLDYRVLDRAQTLGDLLRLLFALLEAVSPKDVADLLMSLDDAVVIEANTVGRWLRNERRPSKPHLRLIVRLLQSRGLVGAPPARDRVFIRIAAFYAALAVPQPSAMVAPARRSEVEQREKLPGERFWALRNSYELALALQSDLESLDEDLSHLNARALKPRPRRFFKHLGSPGPKRFNPAPLLQAIEPIVYVPPPSSWWRRIANKLRALVGAG